MVGTGELETGQPIIVMLRLRISADRPNLFQVWILWPGVGRPLIYPFFNVHKAGFLQPLLVCVNARYRTPKLGAGFKEELGPLTRTTVFWERVVITVEAGINIMDFQVSRRAWYA